MREVADFIRANRARLLEVWAQRVRALPGAVSLPHPLLVDHVPQILDALANAMARGDTTTVPLAELPLIHAAERWREGFDLRQVVAEYRLLRRTIIEEHARHAGVDPTVFVVLNEALDHAITDAVDHYSIQRDNARDLFVGMLGHDLRNPLNAIIMAAQVAAASPDRKDDAIARIQTSGRRMARLIDDLLGFARAQMGGRMPITPKPVDLRPVVAETVRELASAHAAREIRCLTAEALGDFRGEWDAERIAQAISNLVSNAIQHGTDPIVVNLIDEGERGIVLEVGNQGTIPPDIKSRLFTPFARRQGSTGSGLGLYIVREIGLAHRGDVSVSSDPQAGTVFRLSLPRRAAGAPEAHR